ncbi:kinase suppressor of Ras 2-like [Dendronephthya gigantea]|uniref:kinase suppressor of Ras 2-like n=1 Tax=Dendronephthya gigantea TaxID=151771 RepID=UPI00106A7059|nr:kinase suppressor of Ras 2-like [Dendronephthya gigantea]
MAGSVESACVVQVNNMNHLQRMIDISATNLDGLRTQCTTSSDLIQQEIRDQEAKLVRLFSRMLEARQQIEAQCTNYFDYHQYPRLEQWLNVVGIASCGVKAILERYGSFGSLLAAPENQLRDVLVKCDANSDDAWKLISALSHLRKLTEQRKEGRKEGMKDEKTNSYSWSYGKENSVQHNSTSSSSQSSITNTDDAPLTPGSDRGVEQAISPRKSPKPMKRSKSEDLAGKPNIDPLPPGGSLGKNRGKNLWITLPHSGSVDHLSGERNDDNNHNNNLSSSPKTPTRINLGDMHKFSQKHMMLGHCDFCKKQIFRGVKCKKCGLKFHRNCCKNGLPMYGCRFVHMARSMERNNKFYGSLPSRVRPKRANSEPSNINNSVETPRLPMNTSHGDLFQNSVVHRTRGYGEPPPSLPYSPHLFDPVFSGDNASSSASTPQPSPPPSGYIPVPASAPPQGDFETSDRQTITSRSFRRRKGLGIFVFDNVTIDVADSDNEQAESPLARSDSIQSTQSNATITDSGGSDDDAPGVDSIESQISDYDSEKSILKFKTWSHLSEWTVNFNDIELGDCIGKGRIGEVYRGNWHGQVAVKVIDIKEPTAIQLQAFKMQVQTFRKTRHENLVLFMGACMEPPKLAIITSLCKDHHLYKRVHLFKETLPVNKVMLILKQIAQAMSYLHSRGIVHADLKSKNIFFENDSKIVITDFGHFRLAAGLSVEQTRQGTVKFPYGWIYYLAPEIVKSLSPSQKLHRRLFTKQSDVFAFGTVCYELLACSWPFNEYPLEAIVYQVGKGRKQSLSKLDVAREMKDLINHFWSYYPNKRSDFKLISKILEKIPMTKGRLYRSPSQPVTHMLRAVEADF